MSRFWRLVQQVLWERERFQAIAFERSRTLISHHADPQDLERRGSSGAA